jgi:hypothetical protein
LTTPDERHARRERRPYDGTPVYSEVTENIYFAAPDLLEALEGEDPEDLRLVFCDPVYAYEIDPFDLYDDLLPDDVDEVPDWLQEAFDTLNATIRARLEPLSWTPGKVAVDVSSIVARPA